jgi:predicted TIM-barrel fold metal-dependent hydrolase
VIDVSQVRAVDVHTHAEVPLSGEVDPATQAMQDAAAEYFGASAQRPTAQDVAAYYRERNMAAVIFAVDSEAGTGQVPVSNREVLRVAAENHDVLIPFVSVDPHKGKRGVQEARDLIAEGARGFKFHPNLQAFFPDDRLAYGLYEVIAEAGLPALFHTGHSGMGSGMPGGGGIRLKYSNPMRVDDVAVDFPELPIILAHPSFPWQEEAISVAMHKPKVHIDLSGWSPKYFPAVLVQYVNTLLKDKVLFGSDFPVLTPDKWLADLEQTEIRKELYPRILKDNAVRLLGLGG